MEDEIEVGDRVEIVGHSVSGSGRGYLVGLFGTVIDVPVNDPDDIDYTPKNEYRVIVDHQSEESDGLAFPIGSIRYVESEDCEP